mmetsp:Transcript_27376/g.68320  ORF Transcript_27376/g.68320 Transcript_27376/m.68320 type:complete len:158 (-) Transcript_27376:722-1195(-)
MMRRFGLGFILVVGLAAIVAAQRNSYYGGRADSSMWPDDQLLNGRTHIGQGGQFASELSLVQVHLDHAANTAAAAHRLNTAAHHMSTASHELTAAAIEAAAEAHRTLTHIAAGKTNEHGESCSLQKLTYDEPDDVDACDGDEICLITEEIDDEGHSI